MNRVLLGNELLASEISLGWFRAGQKSRTEAAEILKAALDVGIDFFDNADIYGGGHCEEVFAGAIADLGVARDKLYIQTKCGIRKGRYDFSKEHIVQACEGSLQRLGTDYVDALLLHRPDTLMEPEEVAEAFTQLHRQGKVRLFGVSNFAPMQIELLQSALSHKLCINQMQFSITNSTMIDCGIHVNMEDAGAVNRDGFLLEYCRLHGITIQPWSPFQYGFFEGVFIGDEKYPELNVALDEIAAAHGITPTALAIAWILRHPAHMQPILGSMNPARIRETAAASGGSLSREEWYRIYLSAGKILP